MSSITTYEGGSASAQGALRRLEAAGLVRGTWSEAGGRCRRTYELTPAGNQRLGRDRAAWRDFAAAVSATLEPAL